MDLTKHFVQWQALVFAVVNQRIDCKCSCLCCLDGDFKCSVL